MKRRQHRRTSTVILAGVGVLLGMLAAFAPGPAHAATTVGTVYTDGTNLNVRVGPTTAATRVTTLAHGVRVTIVCQTVGQKIRGSGRTTTLWDRLPNGVYVSDAYIKRVAVTLPRCDGPAQGPAVKPVPSAPTAPWVTPAAATLGSGFRTSGRPTHDGVDLIAPRNTPIRSISRGTVVTVVCNASTNNCNIDGSPAVGGCGWYVEVQHVGQIISRYCHMVRRPLVRVGQKVVTGQVIGYVGSSGNSSGPHLHFEVHVNASSADRTNAVNPVGFMRIKGAPLR